MLHLGNQEDNIDQVRIEIFVIKVYHMLSREEKKK